MLHILIYNLLAKISLDLTASLILITRHTFAITIRLLGPKIVPGICKLKYQVLNHLDHALRNIHKYKIEELYTINFQEQLSQISLFFPSKKRYTKPPNMPFCLLGLNILCLYVFIGLNIIAFMLHWTQCPLLYVS